MDIPLPPGYPTHGPCPYCAPVCFRAPCTAVGGGAIFACKHLHARAYLGADLLALLSPPVSFHQPPGQQGVGAPNPHLARLQALAALAMQQQ